MGRDKEEECDSYPHPYTHGHYVPPGPRSSWTDAQYSIYKEEKASWQLDRRRTRLAGLNAMLEEPREVRFRWLIDSSRCGADYHDVEDGDCTCTCGTWDLGVNTEADRDPEMLLYPRSVTDGKFTPTHILHKTLNRIVGDNTPDDTPGSTRASEDPFGSYSNNDEDEFEWLRARGIECVYDHWPSESRKKVARSVTKTCADIEVR